MKDKPCCLNCKHLMFSDFYGECSKAYKGIVSPDDVCKHFKSPDVLSAKKFSELAKQFEEVAGFPYTEFTNENYADMGNRRKKETIDLMNRVIELKGNICVNCKHFKAFDDDAHKINGTCTLNGFVWAKFWHCDKFKEAKDDE